MKQKYLHNTEVILRELALKRGLKYAFTVSLNKGRGSSKDTIGYLNFKKSMITGYIEIEIYSHQVMCSEEELKITIFHEYCHFFWEYVSLKSNKKLDEIEWGISKLYTQNIIPHLHGDPVEDFCDIFGINLLKGDSYNEELNQILQEFISVAEDEIDQDKKIYISRNMPKSYFSEG